MFVNDGVRVPHSSAQIILGNKELSLGEHKVGKEAHPLERAQE
jgi:hypothetical protein